MGKSQLNNQAQFALESLFLNAAIAAKKGLYNDMQDVAHVASLAKQILKRNYGFDNDLDSCWDKEYVCPIADMETPARRRSLEKCLTRRTATSASWVVSNGRVLLSSEPTWENFSEESEHLRICLTGVIASSLHVKKKKVRSKKRSSRNAA